MKHEITVPEVGESISEVVVAEWLKADGDYVEKDEAICEIESDKASFEVPADEAGIIEHKAEEGDTIAVGDVLALVDTEAEKPESEAESTEDKQEEKSDKKTEPSEEETEKQEEEPTKKEEVKISPVASNILKEAGVNAEDVTGTGVDGKITKSDAQKAVEAAKESKEEKPQKKEPAKAITSRPKQPQLTGERETEKSRMSTLRKTIAGRLVSAKNETAMLTTFNEIDMNAVMEVRKQFKEPFEEKYGVRLGFMSFFAKACCVAFNDFPVVNAKLEDDHIIYHNYADIGVAVSTDRGLVVPVVKNADQMSFAQLEETVYDLAVRARDNELSIDEMRGGTFTITNGGVFGSLLSTPIINSPQSAILGMHKIEQRPIALNGEVVIRPMMYVALSYDHRIIDGKDSVQFLVRVKELLENPSRMLLEV